MEKTQYPAGAYRFYVNTDSPVEKYEDIFQIPGHLGVSLERWSAMSDDQKEKRLIEACDEYMGDHIDYGCHPVE